MLLYHGSPNPIENGQLVPAQARNVSGGAGEFVFATDSLVMAHGYALKKPDMFALFQNSFHSAFALVRLSAREEFKNRAGHVYEVPAQGFHQVLSYGEPTGEWTNTKPVPLDTSKKLGVTFNDAVEKGVHVFFVKDKHVDEAHRHIFNQQDRSGLFVRLDYLMRCRIMIYENAEMGHPAAKNIAKFASCGL